MRSFVMDCINALEDRPEDWIQGNHTLFDTRSMVEIWTSNVPILDLTFHRPHKVRLSLYEKLALHKALKRWRTRDLCDRFNKARMGYLEESK